jgi:hypothetical protein
MCFNQTTSLITFSISVVCFTYILYNGIKNKNKYDLFAALITILIGLMQLIEFFLWGNQSCSFSINHFFSLLITVVLYLQALLGSLLYLHWFQNSYPTWFKKMIYSLNAVYFVFVLYLLSWLNQERLCSQPAEGSCRLVWAPFAKMTSSSWGLFLSSIFFFFYFFLGSLGFGFLDKLFLNRINPGILLYPVRYSLLSITFLIATLYSFYYHGRY